ncbi:hypothetical protein BDD12DRAFT_842401 [Trichophaea hybrida]|nr:hypothetical protein BDD12DRAFT_842401 [Trichophaea hybrida]
MAKRKNKQSQSQTQQNSGQHQAKRLRPNNYNDGGDDSHGGKFDASRGYVDPSTGQRGAFPGLENCDEDFFGPPQDGLDYLRMVRYIIAVLCSVGEREGV